MIREVSGDILLSKAQLIAHGVSPNDSFAQGLALSLRQQWPAMYKDFRHYCHTRHPKAGDAWLWSGAGDTHIANLFTQEAVYHAGGSGHGKAAPEHVNHALRALHRIIGEEGYTSVALPRLATGVGGLEWDQVEPLLHRHLGELDIPVLVYTTYAKGVVAEEALAQAG